MNQKRQLLRTTVLETLSFTIEEKHSVPHPCYFVEIRDIRKDEFVTDMDVILLWDFITEWFKHQLQNEDPVIARRAREVKAMWELRLKESQEELDACEGETT